MGLRPCAYLPLSLETKALPHSPRTHVAHVQGEAFLSGLLMAGPEDTRREDGRLTHMSRVRRAGRAASLHAQHEHQQRGPLVTWNLPYVTDCPQHNVLQPPAKACSGQGGKAEQSAELLNLLSYLISTGF